MTCQQCADNSAVFVRACINCAARFCASLPSHESAEKTADRWAQSNGHDAEQIKRLTKRIREERFQKALRAHA